MLQSNKHEIIEFSYIEPNLLICLCPLHTYWTSLTFCSNLISFVIYSWNLQFFILKNYKGLDLIKMLKT